MEECGLKLSTDKIDAAMLTRKGHIRTETWIRTEFKELGMTSCEMLGNKQIFGVTKALNYVSQAWQCSVIFFYRSSTIVSDDCLDFSLFFERNVFILQRPRIGHPNRRPIGERKWLGFRQQSRRRTNYDAGDEKTRGVYRGHDLYAEEVDWKLLSTAYTQLREIRTSITGQGWSLQHATCGGPLRYTRNPHVYNIQRNL